MVFAPAGGRQIAKPPKGVAMLGCYGLRIDGLPDAAPHLVSVPEDAPQVAVRQQLAEPIGSDFQLDDRHAVLMLSDGGSTSEVDRRSGVANLRLARHYTDEELLHPLLSGTFAVTNWWHGRDAFHAGAFVVAGRAWVVLGDKGQGKSSMLGRFALDGIPVMSDDLIVVSGGDVFAGPAFIDLRPDAAEQLGAGRDLGRVGARDRFRLDIATPPHRMPLGGWVQLSWGRELALRPLPVAERLPRLFRNRAVLLQPAAPAEFVKHAALPFFDLIRPKQWSALSAAGHLLVQSVSSLAAS
jgi:hypothetical protein